MTKQYEFDNSCEFNGTTKEEIIADFQNYENEKRTLKIGQYQCKMHPSTDMMCKKVLGITISELLSQMLSELSKNGTKETGLKELFHLYNEPFSEGRIENIVEYAVENIITDKMHVDEGDIPKAGSFRELLMREEDPEKLMKIAKEYKKN